MKNMWLKIVGLSVTAISGIAIGIINQKMVDNAIDEKVNKAVDQKLSEES